MKRDMDLVRAIILDVEEWPTGCGAHEVQLPEYSKEEIGYHVSIMMEADLLEGLDVTSLNADVPIANPIKLTWKGHEFADAARDDNRWQKAKERITQEAGSVTIAVLVKLLKDLMLQAVIPNAG